MGRPRSHLEYHIGLIDLTKGECLSMTRKFTATINPFLRHLLKYIYFFITYLYWCCYLQFPRMNTLCVMEELVIFLFL